MPASSAAAAPPRFDAKFIEEHRILDRYLEGRLPPRGARELERWCHDNPDYLASLHLAERAQASLALLEACGRPLDLAEAKLPWWKSPLVSLASGIVAGICLLGFWALFGKYVLLREELDDTRTRMRQGSLVQPAVQRAVTISPDRAPGLERARLSVASTAPQLIDLHIDLNYARDPQFRVIVDKQDQGRAIILNNVVKDSNGELRLTFNTTGLAAGLYTARIEGIPLRGAAAPIGWLMLEVR